MTLPTPHGGIYQANGVRIMDRSGDLSASHWRRWV